MSETAEKRAEDPAPSAQGFQSCAGPGQDGSADHISGMSLSEQQPKPEDHGIHAHCFNMIANLTSENLRLSNELQMSEDARIALLIEATNRIKTLKDEKTNQELLVMLSQEGRKAQVQKLEKKLEISVAQVQKLEKKLERIKQLYPSFDNDDDDDDKNM